MAGYTKNSDGTYSVNYEDERFKNVESEKNQRLQESTNMYDQMIESSNKFYEDQINASKEWADKQSEIQQKKTDFLVEQTEQQKEKAEKDYTKEQKGAYTDYMKQSNDYGVKAEQLAANGLQNSGYSESSRVSMWNAYQNRYATAREGFNQAILNYNNSIKEALLANDEALAQISYQALQNQLELSLQGFQYKNTLLQTKQQELNQINENYYNRYQDVLAQINTEIDRQTDLDKLYEQIRQSNLEHERWMKDFEATQEQRKIQNAQWEREFTQKQKESDREYQLALAQYNASKKSYSSGGSSDSYSVNNNDNNKVSENGKKLFNNIKRWINYANKGSTVYSKFKDKNYIRDTIDLNYNNKYITETDARYLFDILGL